MSYAELALLILPIIVLAIVDVVVYSLWNKKIQQQKTASKDSKLDEKAYAPNLRLWGLGAILGIAYFLLTKLTFPGDVTSGSKVAQVTADTLSRFSAGNDPVETIAGSVLVLSILALIVYSIVGISRED